jgi:hypothetical protein
MAYSHNGNWIPTIEFNTQKKCEAAADSIFKQTEEHISFGYSKKPWCAKIDK